MLCLRRAENPAVDATARLNAAFRLVTSLSICNCEASWRRICHIIQLLPAFFTLDQLLACVRHLSGLGSWQAWIIAHQVFVNYNFNNNVLFDGQLPNHSIMSMITSIAESALFSINPTVVSNAALIYVGVAARVQTAPVTNAVRGVLVSVRDRLPSTYANERDDMDRFMSRDTHLQNLAVVGD